MKMFDRRLQKLEKRLGTSDAKLRTLTIVSCVTQRIGLDQDTCIQVLDEAGFLLKRGFVLVDLTTVPDGLSAEETKRFLLENGAKICPSGAWGSKGESASTRR